MNQRPPRLSPDRLAAGLLLPLAGYLVIRALIGSSTTALLEITAIPAIWLLGVWVARRRLDPIGVLTLVTTLIALAAFALTHGDPLALKLRRGAVTGPIGMGGALVGRTPPASAAPARRADGKSKPGPRGSAHQPSPATLRDSANRDRRDVSGYRWPQPDRARPNRSDSGRSWPTQPQCASQSSGPAVIVTAWYIRDQNKQINRPRPRSSAIERESR